MDYFRNTWYYKAIINNFQKIWIEAILPIIFFLCLLIYWFGVGEPFERKWIEPVSQPDILIRIFYSALTFFTIGYLLYISKFYLLLYIIFVEFLGDFKAYKEVKAIIWLFLILIMYFKVFPLFIDFINMTISIGYNILQFILYSLPVLGMTIILIIIIYLSYVYIKEKYGKKY